MGLGGLPAGASSQCWCRLALNCQLPHCFHAPSAAAVRSAAHPQFYIYRDPASGQWSMFPWDVESGGPQDEL